MRISRCLIVLTLGLASTCFAQQPTWTLFTPSGFGPRGGGGSVSTAYDAATDRLIVFGGYNPTGSGETNDVWVLINASGIAGIPTWQQVIPNAPAGLPAIRQVHSAVYDPATNRLIIFGGGQLGGGAFATLFQDVWVLTFANNIGGTPQWIPLTPSGGPPAPREGHAAVYNLTTNEMFVFGGGNNGIMSVPNDLWVLENANGIGTPTWIQLSETGNVPGRLENFASAYDQASNRWTVVGGCCFYTNASQVLALNQPGGVPQWTSLSPSGTLPPGGDAAVYGYDPVSNRMIVHGIQPGGGGNATWLLTNANAVGATPTWINLIPEGAPGSPTEGVNRVGSAYNPGTKKLIHAVTLLDALGNLVPEVWVLSNADGSLPAPAIPPVPTGLEAMVGSGSIYLRWHPSPVPVDKFVVEVEQATSAATLNTESTIMYVAGVAVTYQNVGSLTCYPPSPLQPPSCLLTTLQNGTAIQNGVCYRLALRSVLGGNSSGLSDFVGACPGQTQFPVGPYPAHPDHPILFLHGFNGDGSFTSSGGFFSTLHFMQNSLDWKYGGQLYHVGTPLEPTHVSQKGSCPIPFLNFTVDTNAPGCGDDHALLADGDFFTATFGNVVADYNDTPGGLQHQGDEVAHFVAFLYPSLIVPQRISIVAHSNGGLAARDFVTRFPGAPQRVAELITYGTPHRGADVQAVIAANSSECFFLNGICYPYKNSGGAHDAEFDCHVTPVYPYPFLQTLNGVVGGSALRPLPNQISYTAVMGTSQKNTFPLPDGQRNGGVDDCRSSAWDGLVPVSSADLSQLDLPIKGAFAAIRILTTNQTHMGQGNDFPTILCALDSNCTMFQVKSPVDIDVIAPNGSRMGTNLAGIPGASYMNVVEQGGHETATVLIPFPQGGQYTIKAYPKPGAQPTDTFTITLTQNGVTTTIADHMQIQSIPQDGFHPHVNSRPFANAGADQTVECTGPSGTPARLNGSASGDQDGDVLTYVWTDSQGNVVGNAAIVTVLASMGTQTYNLTVTDPSGLSATAQTHITVRDTTPPVLKVTVSPSVLWPPNNKFVPVSANIQVSDVCDQGPAVTLLSITSNDPHDDTTDIQGAVLNTDDRAFLLRARRADKSTQRIYTITYRATDHSGNATTATAIVSVPHDP